MDVGEQVDDGCRVGVGGADGDAGPDSKLGEGVVPAQVYQADQGTLARWELAAAVTLTGDDEHGHPLDQGVGQVECGRIRNQHLYLRVETSDTFPNGVGASQLDQFGAADLGTRVEELTAENQRLRTERDAAPAEAAELTRHLNEGQDDLAGAREGLRRMIRTESSANGGQ